MADARSRQVEHPLDTESPAFDRVSNQPLLSFRVSSVAGITVHNVTEADAVAAVERLIEDGAAHYAAVVNAAKIVAASTDRALKETLERADLVTADGMSVVWAARVLGRPLKRRVAGIDLFERLVERAGERGWRVYFLGAREESVRGVVKRLTHRYPELRVAGFRNGYFAAEDSAQLAESIRATCADVLFVALGSPAQEQWIRSNLAATGVRFAMGVGGSFDHISGFARRAPHWMQRAGLEWLYRLAREPRRLWRRYLIGNSRFVWLVLRDRLFR